MIMWFGKCITSSICPPTDMICYSLDLLDAYAYICLCCIWVFDGLSYCRRFERGNSGWIYMFNLNWMPLNRKQAMVSTWRSRVSFASLDQWTEAVSQNGFAIANVRLSTKGKLFDNNSIVGYCQRSDFEFGRLKSLIGIESRLYFKELYVYLPQNNTGRQAMLLWSHSWRWSIYRLHLQRNYYY